VDEEGYLTGQAFVEAKSAEKGNILYIYQGAPKDVAKVLGTLKAGDRVLLPSPVHVVRRFPRMK
jgi:glycine hydroxymethyltransferase